MIRAYVLVESQVGLGADVAPQIRNVRGVISAEDVTGIYDVIVLAEAASLDELGRIVVAEIQQVPGITRTMTCPVVNLA